MSRKRTGPTTTDRVDGHNSLGKNRLDNRFALRMGFFVLWDYITGEQRFLGIESAFERGPGGCLHNDRVIEIRSQSRGFPVKVLLPGFRKDLGVNCTGLVIEEVTLRMGPND